MKKIRRLFSRFTFYSLKIFIVFISYFNHRLYMNLYIPLLKYYGLTFEGRPRYIGKDVVFDDFSKITLGNRVVISNDCHLLTHDYSITTALIAIGKKPRTDIALVRGIKIGNNVFIGKKSIIMPNTVIGDNVIIGGGSVVRGKIDDNSIMLGNPATKVGTVSDLAKKWEMNLGTKKVKQD